MGCQLVRLGGALHENEGLMQKASCQIVLKGIVSSNGRIGAAVATVRGINIHRCKIQLFRQFPVVDVAEKGHQIGGHGGVGVKCADGCNFCIHKVRSLVGYEPVPIQLYAMHGYFADGRRRLDLLPIGIGVGPKGGPPCCVQLVKSAVSFL